MGVSVSVSVSSEAKRLCYENIVTDNAFIDKERVSRPGISA